MAPSRPPLTDNPSFTQTTLNEVFFRVSSSSMSKIDKTTRVSKSSPPAKSKSKPQSKPKSPSSKNKNRVFTDVLLAIKPVHLANIASREKNHEYRKYRLRDEVTRLWFYETGDDKGRSSITHIAVIPATTRHEPGSVPTEPVGIGNAEFNAGLKVSKYGYPVLELYELVRPVTLAEMKTRWGMGGAPMGWRYVEREMWEDRWGGGKDRSEKVTRIF